jgi:uncharacterized protein (DUF2267 family)
MTRVELLDRIASRMGLEEPDGAEPAVRAVLKTLGERLSRVEADTLASHLPESLAGLLRTASNGQAFDLEEFYYRVSRRRNEDPGRAREESVVICRVLVELAGGEDTSRRIMKELPGEFAELLTLPEPIHEPERVHLHPERRTLAEGRPGGARPLYAARADRAQSQSVVRADNPHGDTKLSSAEGLTQEREEETLASGKPGSGRPLNEADPDTTVTYSR